MSSRIVKGLVLASLGLVACGGGTGPAISQDAVIALDRDPVSVAAYVGTTEPVGLQVINQGRDLLTIHSVRLVAVDGGTLAGVDAGGVFDDPQIVVDAGAFSDPLPVALGGLQTGFVQFNYRPRHAGADQALLIIDSDAPGTPQLIAPINACAAPLDGGACD